MIEYLRLSQIGVINDAELDLAGGLTVLTGETGAGKTLILSGLHLLLGGRPRAGLASGDGARVEGIWNLPPDHPAVARVAEAGGVVDAGELVITRTLTGTGRARSAAGGATVPVAVLAQAGELLVAVHGQSDQLLLRKPAAQRELLDAYAADSICGLAAEYRRWFDEVIDLDAQLSRSEARSAATSQELEALRRELDAIEAVEPIAGEDDELRATVDRLARVQEFQVALHGALSVMASSDDESPTVPTLLDHARRTLDGLAQLDPELGKLQSRIIEVQIMADDLGCDLSRYLDRLDTDPVALETAMRRLAAITELTRAHGPRVSDVLAWSREAGLRLMDLEDQADVAGLRLRRERARVALGAAAEALHSARLAAAGRLREAITAELRMLSLPRAEFVVEVAYRSPTPGQEPLAVRAIGDDGSPGAGGATGPERRLAGFGPNGADDVRLLLAPHPGAMPAPIAGAASGGELSRVMLAIEVVLAANSDVATYVFDEVDAGIGGKAALEVGRRLARLARRSQVIVVTHLAQVAAFADDHLVVEKSDDSAVTTAGVRHVRGDERVKEIARMLSGHDESPQALEHATELLRIGTDGRCDAAGQGSPGVRS